MKILKLDEYLSQFSKECTTINVIGPFSKSENELIEPIIYVDSATQFRINNKGFSVGDNDSFSGTLDEILPIDKDFSDLSYVLSKLCPQFNEINLFGFLGGRKDHEMINLLEAYQYLKMQNQKTKVSFDQKIIGFSKGSWAIDIHGIFSIIAFEELEIEITGQCKFEVDKSRCFKPLSSHGLSNIGSGEVHIQSSQPFFLFLNE